MSNEEQQKLVQDAIRPFEKEGITKVGGQIIKLPLDYRGSTKIDPMDYSMETLEQSEIDYFPELQGICMLCAIHMTARKIRVQIAFKENGDQSHYKILI